ncbi:unnamed protein product [Haemonchus placei]|uniref:RNA-directed DNA polymerase n=1 Tax=Haemonchus placei TaxID=6290 RepID=A0A0N4WA15_HAEPC|nr:unnamed protein product [Haemonchus placei]
MSLLLPLNRHPVQLNITHRDPSYKVDLENCDLNADQRNQLQHLLDSFHDVFSKHQYDIGSCTAGKESAFMTLRDAFIQRPILGFPSYEKPFYIFTDASAVAQAGALMQEFEEGQKRFYAVAYCSRTLSDTERSLPLSFALTQEHTFPVAMPCRTFIRGMDHSVDMAAEQQKDPFLEKVLNFKNDPSFAASLPESQRASIAQFASKVTIAANGCLYYQHHGQPSHPLLVVPQTLQPLVFSAHHSSALSGGHMGWRKTLAKILRKYYWPSVYSDIHKWCDACMTCQMRRQPNPAYRERLIPVYSETVFAKILWSKLHNRRPKPSVINIMEQAAQSPAETIGDQSDMNVTSIEGPSPKPTYFSNDNPEQCNTEAILPVDEEVEAMDIGMDASTPPLDQVNVEIKEKQAIKSFDLLVTSTEEPAPKYFKPRDDKSSSSETDNSSDYDPSSFLDEPFDTSNNDKNSSTSEPITEAQAEESANLTSQITSAPALGEDVIRKAATDEGVVDTLASLVALASVRPCSPVASTSRAGYNGLVDGLCPIQCSPDHEPVGWVSILAAVGPNAVENFRKNNDCSNLIELRRKGEPLPKMPLVAGASLEEQNLSVRGLVLDGKSGIALTKLIIGDLVWVYSLVATVKFATSDMELPRTVTEAMAYRKPNVWRVGRFALVHRDLNPTLGFITSIQRNPFRISLCMQGHRQIVQASLFRLAEPGEAPRMDTDTFIVAPFRERQIDYMVFTCQWKGTDKELASFMADVPYYPSQAPAPFDIRLTSKEHQELVRKKLHNFDLFRERPNDVGSFLAALYSTACGTITACIAESTDTTVHAAIWSSPNINSFSVLAQFRIPMRKKAGWAVGRSIQGAYEQDLMHAQIVDIEMEEGYLDVTIRLDTNDGVRCRAYLLASKNQRIAVGTFLHTVDERANPVLALMEQSSAMAKLTPNTIGWKAARLLLAGDVQVSGYDYPDQDAITVTVAGSQIKLNANQRK